MYTRWPDKNQHGTTFQVHKTFYYEYTYKTHQPVIIIFTNSKIVNACPRDGLWQRQHNDIDSRDDSNL